MNKYGVLEIGHGEFTSPDYLETNNILFVTYT